MKKKKIDKEKVKAILKKSLDIFCYIVTALAVTIGIAMGVNGCSGSNEPERIDPQQTSETLSRLNEPRRAVDLNECHVYIARYDGTIQTDFGDLRGYYNVPTSIEAVQRSAIMRNIWYGGGYDYNPSYAYYNGQFLAIARTRVTFTDLPVQSGTTQFEYVLTRYDIILEGGSWIHVYSRSNMETTEGDEGVYQYVQVVCTTNAESDKAFNTFFYESETKNFTFNAEFNYNAPFGLQYDAVYGTPPDTGWFDGTGDTMKYRLYDVGWFWSNGRIFNQIQWWAIKGSGVSVLIDGNISTLEYDGNYVYTFMYYRNSMDANPDLTSVLVNARDSVPYNGGNSRYYSNSSTWIVPAYRNITFLSTPSDDIVDLFGSFNNNNQYDTGGLSAGGDMGDVFTLIASSFTGLLPILTLQIIPSVTIGTLLFVPLVAMLVFAIIRIIKK